MSGHKDHIQAKVELKSINMAVNAQEQDHVN